MKIMNSGWVGGGGAKKVLTCWALPFVLMQSGQKNKTHKRI